MANNNFNVSSSSILHENSLALPLNSINLAQNHVNEQGRINPQSLALTIGVQPNNLFGPQRGHPTIGLGQFAIGQRLNEVRRTHASPLRVRIHTIIEYLPTAAQNQYFEALPLHPTSDCLVTEIARTTQFFPSASPREILFAPNHNNIHLQSLILNDGIRNQGIPNFQNHNLTISNQGNHHNAYRPYSPQNRPMINFMNLDHLNHSDGNNDGVVLNPKPVSVYAPGILRAQNPNLNLGQNQNLETSQLDVDQVRINPRDQGRVIPTNQSNTNSEDEQEMDLGDGITHSLPHRKYGPYICPKCKEVFQISQFFAAHMLTHYKSESKEQRKRRLAAKNKKKNLHQVRSRGNGLTISPVGTENLHQVHSRGNELTISPVGTENLHQVLSRGNELTISPVSTERKVPLKVYVRRKKAAGGKVEMAPSKRVVEDKVQDEGQGKAVLDEASSSSPVGVVNKGEPMYA